MSPAADRKQQQQQQQQPPIPDLIASNNALRHAEIASGTYSSPARRELGRQAGLRRRPASVKDIKECMVKSLGAASNTSELCLFASGMFCTPALL
jgi:hypothetical protein